MSSGGTLFDAFFVIHALKNSMYVNTGGVNGIRIERSGGHQLFDLRDGDLTRHGHQGIEVAGGGAEDEITMGISFPRFYDGEVGFESHFHQVILSVEISHLFTDGHFGSYTRWREYCGHSVTGC